MGAVQINYLAVLVAALAGFMVGGLWYSPLLFGNAWMRAAEMTETQIASGNKLKSYGLALLLTLIMSYCLAAFLAAPEVTLQTGALYGFLAGFGWIFFGIAVIALFEQRSWSYILINGGYWAVAMTVMGAILGAWT